MRKKAFKLLFLLFFILSFTGCNVTNSTQIASATTQQASSDISKNEFTVTYICDNGIIKTSETRNKKALYLVPSLNEYQKLICWCTDFELKNEFDFNTKLNSDITLYAKCDIDFVSLTNDISTKYMVYNIKVESTFKSFGFTTSIYHTIGSGAIIAEDDTYYYALTNNHVVAMPEGYSHSSYIVKDCYENEYDANLIYNLNTYDLALIKFAKNSDVQLAKVRMAESSPLNNETIISLGSPHGQNNYITYGYFLGNVLFEPLEDSINISNVRFEVITHSAPINNGSSGGAVLNTNMELIGINFASSTNKNGEFLYTYTIPIEKVKEFLELAQK